MGHLMGSRVALGAFEGNISFSCEKVLNVSSRLPGYVQNGRAYVEIWLKKINVWAQEL
jgi:hypothetical protein